MPGLQHVAASGEDHLAVLDVEIGLGELVEVADVVVVEVGDDHVPDGGRVDADGLQTVRRAAQEGSPPSYGCPEGGPASPRWRAILEGPSQ